MLYKTLRQAVNETAAFAVDVVVWMFAAGAEFCWTCFTEHHSSRSHQLHSQLPAGSYALLSRLWKKRDCQFPTLIKKLRYRRGTVWRTMSVEILTNAAQLH